LKRPLPPEIIELIARMRYAAEDCMKSYDSGDCVAANLVVEWANALEALTPVWEAARLAQIAGMREMIARWRWAAKLGTHTCAEINAQQAGWSQCADELEVALSTIPPAPVDAPKDKK
jgi:hypothetical protein